MMPPIQADLLQFLSARVPDDEALTPETDLLESELLDSLLIMDLVAHIEKTHQVKLGNADIAPRHFRTIESLTHLVVERKA